MISDDLNYALQAIVNVDTLLGKYWDVSGSLLLIYDILLTDAIEQLINQRTYLLFAIVILLLDL